MREPKVELSIVIPVYNEPANIVATLRAIKKTITVSHEVIVVYDTDTDTTLPVLRRLKKQYRTLRVIKNTIIRGPSGAIRTGFASAKAPYTLVTMADLCDDLTQVKELMRLVSKHAAIACPSRYCKGGKQELAPSLKVWAPRLAGLLLHFISGIATVDPTNSFKLYHMSLIRKLSLKSTISFSVTLEIISKAHILGYTVAEIPTTWHDRQNGKTSFKLGSSLIAYIPWFCLTLLRNRVCSLPLSMRQRIVKTI